MRGDVPRERMHGFQSVRRSVELARPLNRFGAMGNHGCALKDGLNPLRRPFVCILDAAHAEETRMSEHVYKILELTGSSPTSIEDAVGNAITKAAKTVRRMQWFQVLETRGHITDGSVSHWQVTLKVGFTLDE